MLSKYLKSRYSVWILSIMGIMLVLSVVIIPRMIESRLSENAALAIQNMRIIHSIQLTYADKYGYGNFGTAEQLEQENYLEPELATAFKTGREYHGYIYQLKLTDKGFKANATPKEHKGVFRTGNRSVFINETGVMRTGPADRLARFDDLPM